MIDQNLEAGPAVPSLMMHLFVSGEPHGAKSGTDKSAMHKWQEIVREKTAGEKRMAGPCKVRIDFVLPKGSYQETNKEMPYGADVDNLAAAALDALKEHVLPRLGGDGAVMELLATKREAREGEDSGALITVNDVAF
jgi:Holliday junction resolvase RusA-like endonuclease